MRPDQNKDTDCCNSEQAQDLGKFEYAPIDLTFTPEKDESNQG